MGGNTITMVLYLVVLGGIFYFMGIRPQKKEQKRKQEMLNSMAIGDYCVTTSGFYGKIIDITNEMVIIEFGNKNCRIPMMKAAISSIEKADALTNGVSQNAEVSDKETK